MFKLGLTIVEMNPLTVLLPKVHRSVPEAKKERERARKMGWDGLCVSRERLQIL